MLLEFKPRRGSFTAREGTEGSRFPPTQGKASLSHILGSVHTWWLVAQGRDGWPLPRLHPTPAVSFPRATVHEPAFLSPCRLREGANREILGIIVSYKVKVKLVVSRGG